MVLDLDADGKDELLFKHSALNPTKMYARDVPAAKVREVTGLPPSILIHSYKVADVNGDGLADVVAIASAGAAPAVYLNNGGNFVAPLPLPAEALGWPLARVLDVNHDGLSDFLIPRLTVAGQNQTMVNGYDVITTRFDAQGKLAFHRLPLFDVPLSLFDDVKKLGARVVDVEGDGDSDILYFHPVMPLTLHKHVNGKPDLLEIIHDGRHAAENTGVSSVPTVRITYAPVTDASVYKPGDCAFIEFMPCLRAGPMRVVKRVETDAGLYADGTTLSVSKNVSDYFYRDGRFDRKSSGFAGFADIVVKSRHPVANSGGIALVGEVTTRSFYANTVPDRAPRLEERWTFTYAGNNRYTLQRENFEWQRLAMGPTYRDYVEVDTQRAYEWDLNLGCGFGSCPDTMPRTGLEALGYLPYRTVRQQHRDPDAHGNIRRRITTFGTNDNEGTDVRTEYDNDETNWLIGRPKKVTVIDRTKYGAPVTAQTRTIEYTYHTDANKRHLVKQKKMYGSSATAGNVLTVEHDYYGDGLLSRRTAIDNTTGKKREATFAYDPFGFPHAVASLLGTSYSGHDPVLGVQTVELDVNGVRTDRAHDTLGRVTRIRSLRRPDDAAAHPGVETTLAYTLPTVGLELLPTVEIKAPDGAKTQTVYDRAGRTLRQRFKGFDGTMREKQNTYDALGRLVASTTYKRTPQQGTESNYEIQREYDNLNRPVKQVEPGGHTRSWIYDKLETTAVDARGHKRSTQLDARLRLVKSVDGVGTSDAVTRTYLYRPFGNLWWTEVEGVANSWSSYSFAETGELESIHEPDRGYKSFWTDAFGEITMRIEGGDAVGTRRTLMEYDDLGRVTSVVVDNGPGTGVTRSRSTFTYDSITGDGARATTGALLRTEFEDLVAGGVKHTIDMWYDALARPLHTDHILPHETVKAFTETLRVTRGYDELGRLSSMTYPALAGQSSGTRVVYEYAPAATSNGRLQLVKAVEHLAGNLPHETELWRALATDPQDLLSDAVSGSVRIKTVFDWRGLVTSLQVQANDGPKHVLAMRQFGYDAEGNLRSRTNDLQSASEYFGYDALNRLQVRSTTNPNPYLAPDESFAYDTLGNLTNSTLRGTYTFDPQKPTQVTSVTGGIVAAGTRNYSYDYWGNQVSRPDAKRVVYNDFDLPVRISDADDENKTKAWFVYNSAGMRARRITSNESVTYVPGLYERHRASDGRIEHRLLVPAAGAALTYRQEGATLSKMPTLQAHGDHLGSTNLVTRNDLESSSDGSARTVLVENRRYDAFGLRRNPDWLSADVFGGVQPAALDQGFSGHDEDFETGLISMKGRVYDPKLGRFLSADPFLDGRNPTQRWNRYAYVSNNPLNTVDPSGFDGECLGLETICWEQTPSPVPPMDFPSGPAGGSQDMPGGQCGPGGCNFDTPFSRNRGGVITFHPYHEQHWGSLHGSSHHQFRPREFRPSFDGGIGGSGNAGGNGAGGAGQRGVVADDYGPNAGAHGASGANPYGELPLPTSGGLTYGKFSALAHAGLSAGGAVPALGIVPDTVDLAMTVAEYPFGYSDGADIALGMAGIAMTLLPFTGDGAAAAAKASHRITFTKSVDIVDEGLARRAGQYIADNRTARAYYGSLQKQGTKLEFASGELGSGIAGQFFQFENKVTIDLANAAGVEDIARTLVHESTHQRRFFQGRGKRNMYTQYEEFLAARNEALVLGRRPTLAERRAIWADVQSRYHYYPEGRNPFGLTPLGDRPTLMP
jgi:RHS repeat-associated protein